MDGAELTLGASEPVTLGLDEIEGLILGDKLGLVESEGREVGTKLGEDDNDG